MSAIPRRPSEEEARELLDCLNKFLERLTPRLRSFDPHLREEAIEMAKAKGIEIIRTGEALLMSPEDRRKWITVVLRNAAFELARRKCPISLNESHESLIDTSSNDIERHEISEMIHKVVNRLPIKYRQPVVWKCLEGRNLADVAETYDIPIATLYWRFNKGILMLRETLKDMKLFDSY